MDKQKYERPAWSVKFYSGKRWQQCRNAYVAYRKGLCERCLEQGIIKPGTEVHHKIFMNAETVQDDSLAYGWDNLILLCRGCHTEMHHGLKRWKLQDDGTLIAPHSLK